MSRRHLTFACEGAQLAGTLDEAEGDTGLLIVSGGNEVRSGAWSGQALLARRIAVAGHPVFRFDRRGVGDSEGFNLGFTESERDIAAALAAFREARPRLAQVAAFGNCDAASALMLSAGAGFDMLALANPWTIEDEAAPPPPAVVRGHYLNRLRDRQALRRLVTGKVSLAGALHSLRGALRRGTRPADNALASAMAGGLARFSGPVSILLAERDRTAMAFRAIWPGNDRRVHLCPGASHSFVEAEARDWLVARLLALLAG